ncbi:MAG: hypothetical protein ACREA2_21325 [Blastocatellia bacterium]
MSASSESSVDQIERNDLSEDPTKDLTAVEMLRLLLADVRDIERDAVQSRLSSRIASPEDRARDGERRAG